MPVALTTLTRNAWLASKVTPAKEKLGEPTVAVAAFQLMPSAQMYTISPARKLAVSTPLTVCDATLVLKSVLLLPVSLLKLTLCAVVPLLNGAKPLVSKVKLVVCWLLALPATSVLVALTLMTPSPKVVTSSMVRVTPLAAPVPVNTLRTVLPARLNNTTVLLANSALTVTTPDVWVASMMSAPSATPVPKAMTGVAAATVSST